METLVNQVRDYFKDLSFIEETHKYFVKGSPLKISVSGLIHKYEHITDWEQVLINAAERKGITTEEEKARWDAEALLGQEIGTATHLFGENYVFDRTLKPTTGWEEAIVKFWDDLPSHIIPLILEVQMYHKEYMFAGTADIVLYNTEKNTITIGDYKTNKDLFKNFKEQKMQAPFEKLVCCPYNHYQLQLSYYQILLEQFLKDTDIRVVGRKLIYLKPDSEYEIYDLDDYTEVLRKELKLKGI